MIVIVCQVNLSILEWINVRIVILSVALVMMMMDKTVLVALIILLEILIRVVSAKIIITKKYLFKDNVNNVPTLVKTVHLLILVLHVKEELLMWALGM